MKITIHYKPSIAWQEKRVGQFKAGLQAMGFDPILTNAPNRITDHPAILFGTTHFTQVEDAPGDWMLVDRASFLDPDYVQLGWNGRGGKGEYMTPFRPDLTRWESFGIEAEELRAGGGSIVLCGEGVETQEVLEWYQVAAARYEPTHFRPHPACRSEFRGLPAVNSFRGASLAVTYRSSVAIEAMLAGVYTVVENPEAMSYGYSHNRADLFSYLAWTQWSWSEIQRGEVGHLFTWLNDSSREIRSSPTS